MSHHQIRTDNGSWLIWVRCISVLVKRHTLLVCHMRQRQFYIVYFVPIELRQEAGRVFPWVRLLRRVPRHPAFVIEAILSFVWCWLASQVSHSWKQTEHVVYEDTRGIAPPTRWLNPVAWCWLPRSFAPLISELDRSLARGSQRFYSMKRSLSVWWLFQHSQIAEIFYPSAFFVRL